MRTSILRKYSLPLILIIILAGLFSIMTSCGGGGGGGGNPVSMAPFIYAKLFSIPTGSSLPGYESALVYVLDDNSGDSIATAVVTINGVALAYSSAYEYYEGDVIVAPGGSVVLNVTVAGKTYASSVTQFTSYPVIAEPDSGATWVAGLPHIIKWSGSYPTTNTFIGLGILEDDPNGQLLWPSSGYLLEVSSSDTSYTISANSLTSGNDL